MIETDSNDDCYDDDDDDDDDLKEGREGQRKIGYGEQPDRQRHRGGDLGGTGGDGPPKMGGGGTAHALVPPIF